jgi:biopolymer transport protein ExbB
MSGSQILRIIDAFAAGARDPDESRRMRLERMGADLTAEMSRRIEVLGGISVVAPLLGLLGTVTGMMLSFQEIAAASGTADMNALAAGIWEAMITTAGGLIVAILAYISHGYFTGEINRRLRGMNFAVQNLEEVLHRESRAGSPR